jgi:CubicO group peptidase (beta-lactamase class C family)
LKDIPSVIFLNINYNIRDVAQITSNMGRLSTSTIESLTQRVQSSCNDPVKDIPGVTVVVVDKHGEELFAHSAGNLGVGSTEPMTLENIFWIASCTKMVTGIACMQLVEKGILTLDSSNLVERLCPELKEVKVLTDDGTLVEKKRGITLRMLLSHTGTNPKLLPQIC